MIDLERNDAAKGKSGTFISSGTYGEEYLADLQGVDAAAIYSKMERSDYQIQKVMAAIQNPIKAASWSIDPVSQDPNDMKVAQIIEQIILKDLNFQNKLEEIITFIPRGHAVFEVINLNKVSKELGPYTGLLNLAFRDQSSLIKWVHDPNTGELLSIDQKQGGDVGVDVSLPAQFLCVFFNRKKGDDNGFPMLRPLYGPYKRKLLIEELKMIGIERSAIPVPKLQVPAGTKTTDVEYQTALDMLQGYTSGENAYVVYPAGWELELVSNVFDPTKLEATIKSEDEKMAGSVLAMFVELGTGGNAGSLALSENLEKFFTNGIVGIAQTIADTINQRLIPALVKLNFGDTVDNYPKLMFSGIAESAGLSLMSIITGYKNAGILNTDAALEDHIRKVHKLPKRMEGTAMDNGGNNADPSATPPDSGNGADTSSNDSTNNQEAPKLAEVIPANIAPIILMAEKPSSLIEKKSGEVKSLMVEKLTLIKEKMLADITRYYKQLPASKKLKAIKMVTPGYSRKFKDELRGALASASALALEAARKEVPSKSKVKLKNSDEIMKVLDPEGTFKFDDFSKLPPHVQALLALQSDLVVEKVVGDLADRVSFQFVSSSTSTDSLELIIHDLNQAADAVIASPNIQAAATNSVSTMVNETRSSFFFDPEVIDAVSSFTFINADPVSEICKSLAGMVFEVSDAEALRYNPPLHHNCKSYLQANLKGAKNSPEITGLPSISEKAKNSITLTERLAVYRDLVNTYRKGNYENA